MTLRLIAGKYKGRLLQTPRGSTTRPTQSMVREAVFNMCQFDVEGALFLDLFAGSGAMGFEALSRGAKHVTFVERNKGALFCLKKNIDILEVAAQVTVFPLDALTALQKMSNPFDLIYLDPPYDMHVEPFLQMIAAKSLLRGSLFLEERAAPHNKKFPSIPGLQLEGARTYGSALVSRFIAV